MPQQDLHEVEGGEADAHGDGALEPVHAQAFVEAAHHALLPHDGTHGAHDGGALVACDAGRLHAPPHHVQRVRGRLPDEARAGPEDHALEGVGLQAAAVLSVQALKCLVGEEAQASVRDDPQHSGNESMIKGLQPLFSRDADEDVKDVAVHFLRGHGHPCSDQVQRVCQRGSRSSSQCAREEAGPRGQSFSAEAIVSAQDALVLLVRAELDGGVGHHAHHGGRVSTPQAEEAFVEVGEVEEPEGLLGGKSFRGHLEDDFGSVQGSYCCFGKSTSQGPRKEGAENLPVITL